MDYKKKSKQGISIGETQHHIDKQMTEQVIKFKKKYTRRSKHIHADK